MIGKKISSWILFFIVLSSVVFGAQDLNVTTQSKDAPHAQLNALGNLRVTNVRQDPFPANPGEYVDVYFKVENGGGEIVNPRFDFVLQYPFSVYPAEEASQRIPSLDPGDKVTLHYKLKVDEQAVPGEYEGGLRAYINDQNYYPSFFPLKVEDVTSSFDVVVQGVNKDGVSLAVANTGKNPANSITINVGDQSDFDLLGTSSSIIGSLNAGDYTLINALLVPKANTGSDLVLKVKIEYTDTIGTRRSVEKDVPLALTYQVQKGFGDLRSAVTVQSAGKAAGGISTSMKVALVVVVLLVLGFLVYRRRKKKDER